MQITRRDFIAFSGFTLAGITLGEWGRSKLLAKEEYKDALLAGIGKEEFKLSICGQCPAGCGIMVRLVDGYPRKIDGNPLCPLSRGKLCPKGQNGLQVLYDPDRLVGPVKRIGKKGESQWEKISWEEAVDIVANKLKELKDNRKAHQLLVLTQENRGLSGKLWEQFTSAYGTPNLVQVNLLRDPGILWAHFLMQGIKDYPAYDVENARYILSFGTPLLEGWYSPTWMQRMYGNFRRERPETRGKLVQIEPRLSPTAANADEWVGVNPGTEAALALGLAYTIIKEGRYDENFVREHTFGFEDWTDKQGQEHLGFKNWILEEYTTEAVSKITGVPIVTIIRLARDFAELKPALAIGERRPNSGGFNIQMAVLALNALVGGLDSEGGTLIQREVPFKKFPTVEPPSSNAPGAILDKSSLAGWEVFPHLTYAILEERPYPLEILFLDKINPFSNCYPVGDWAQALTKIPFIVSFSPFLDETSQYADLILPDHTFLEKWQDVVPYPTFGSPCLGVCQPAVEPFLDTKDTVELILEISHKLDEEMQKSLPWRNHSELLQDGLRGVYESRRGMVFGSPFQGAWMRQMEKGGWWSAEYSNFEEFWNQILEKGGWWDPLYEYQRWDRTFQTPSGKFEFYSQTLEKLTPEGQARGKSSDSVILPYYEAPSWQGEENLFPFYLNVFELLTFSALLNSNQPYLYEHITPHLPVQWQSWVEIHPEKAKQLGIKDDDWVWVESVLGKIKIKAKLYPETLPEVISIPLGLSNSGNGRWSPEKVANPNRLASGNGKPSDKNPSYLRVKLYKA
jgi:anaerobic selenocysteine-containing dehydrogenase